MVTYILPLPCMHFRLSDHGAGEGIRPGAASWKRLSGGEQAPAEAAGRPAPPVGVRPSPGYRVHGDHQHSPVKDPLHQKTTGTFGQLLLSTLCSLYVHCNYMYVKGYLLLYT